MALKNKREKAVRLRLKGCSYSQIKKELGLSKGTLSSWLYDMPLSSDRLRELRDLNPRRIEKFRNTMRKKREERLLSAYRVVSKNISSMSKRELFIAGFFLYWGEGAKTGKSFVALTNTNPAVVRFFIRWLLLQGVSRSKLRAKLHLYSDMNIKKQTLFWVRELGLPISQFRKPYVKESKKSKISYKGLYGQGTCTVFYGNAPLTNYVLMGVKYISDVFGKKF